MNTIFSIVFLSIGAIVSGNLWGGQHYDNRWNWNGIPQQQNWDQWNRWNNWNSNWANGPWNNKYTSFGPAPLGPDGRVVDTPEVEKAKAEHFAAKEAALKQVSSVPIHSQGIQSTYPTYPTYIPPTNYPTVTYPTNDPPVNYPTHVPVPAVTYPTIPSTGGYPSNIPSVSFPTPSPSPITSGTVLPGNIAPWGHGMTAYGPAPLGPDGRVIDTPEVAKAKEEHFAALAAAIKANPTTYAPLAPVMYSSWTTGAAPVGPDGRVVDTPEVAHAKAAHYAAKAAASQTGFNRWW